MSTDIHGLNILGVTFITRFAVQLAESSFKDHLVAAYSIFKPLRHIRMAHE